MDSINTLANIVIAASTFIATFINYKMFKKSEHNRRLAKYDGLILDFITTVQSVTDMAIQYWTTAVVTSENDPIKIGNITFIKTNIKKLEHFLKILSDEYGEKIDSNSFISVFNKYKNIVTGWDSETVFKLDKNKCSSIIDNSERLLRLLYNYSFKG